MLHRYPVGDITIGVIIESMRKNGTGYVKLAEIRHSFHVEAKDFTVSFFAFGYFGYG